MRGPPDGGPGSAKPVPRSGPAGSWTLDDTECIDVLGGSPRATGTVCNGATGDCDDPPAVPSSCCANLGPAIGLPRGFCLAPFPSNFNCVISGEAFCNAVESARWNGLEICMIDLGSSLDASCDTAECEFACGLEDYLCPCECLDDAGCSEDGMPIVCASEYAACIGNRLLMGTSFRQLSSEQYSRRCRLIGFRQP